MASDTFALRLLALLSGERYESATTLLVRYLLDHAAEVGELSERALARRARVGTGTIARLANALGCSGFEDLRACFAGLLSPGQQVFGADPAARAHDLQARMEAALDQVAHSVDLEAVERLVDDIEAAEHITVLGLHKSAPPALWMQADLLAQGVYVEVCTSCDEQVARLTRARGEELFIVFAERTSYFDAHGLENVMRHANRPKVWVVCGELRELPFFVTDRLSFLADGDPLTCPYQLSYVAGLIAQELAARRG